MRRLIRIAPLLVLLALAAGAMNVDAAPPIQHGVPSKLVDLQVQPENISATLAQDTRDLWVDHVHLYSLRAGKELMATLEVGTFKKGAAWQTTDFQFSIANSLGSSNPLVVRLQGVSVYLTSLRTLRIAAWFRHGTLFILSVRSNYASPKTLIRQALEVNP